MRTIKFRGKNPATEEWVFGNYWRDLYEEHIVEVVGNIHDNPELLNQEI